MYLYVCIFCEHPVNTVYFYVGYALNLALKSGKHDIISCNQPLSSSGVPNQLCTTKKGDFIDILKSE